MKCKQCGQPSLMKRHCTRCTSYAVARVLSEAPLVRRRGRPPRPPVGSLQHACLVASRLTENATLQAELLEAAQVFANAECLLDSLPEEVQGNVVDLKRRAS